MVSDPTTTVVCVLLLLVLKSFSATSLAFNIALVAAYAAGVSNAITKRKRERAEQVHNIDLTKSLELLKSEITRKITTICQCHYYFKRKHKHIRKYIHPPIHTSMY